MERLTEKRDGKNVIPLRNAITGLDVPYWKLSRANDLEIFLYGAAADKLAAYEDGDSPSAVPVRHGTWIKADEQPYFRKHYHTKVCSECGKRKDGKWLYCPYCGSKNQDGGQDDG